MKKVIFGLIVFISMLTLPAFSFERLNFGQGFIADNAKVISRKDTAIINAFLWDLHYKTTADLAVVTLNSLQSENIEDTAMHIAKAFQVGAIGKDNGAVLVIAPREKKAAIYVGFDFDEIIPERRIRQIVDEIILKDFNEKDISTPIYKAATILTADISNMYNQNISGLDYTLVPPMPVDKATKMSILYGILSLISFILAFFAWLHKKRNDAKLGTDFAFGGNMNTFGNW